MGKLRPAGHLPPAKEFDPARGPVLWLTVSASLGYFIVGLVRAYTSSAIPSMGAIDSNMIQNVEQKSWIGAIAPVGAFTGSLLSGTIMRVTGRRRALQIAAPYWAAVWLFLGFSQSLPMVLLGRIFTGFGVGMVLAPAQVYVSECCDPETRGRLGSVPALFMSLGILVSYVAGKWLYWRHLAFFSAGFCVIFFLVLLPLPESPAWLEGRGLDSLDAMNWLKLSPKAVASIKDTQLKNKSSEVESLYSKKVLFSSPVYKPMIIGFMLLIFQQFSGIDAVIFFTVEIFDKAGGLLDPTTSTIVVGVVQLLVNGVSTMVVDKFGRRPLLMISAVIMSASMVSMGAAYYFEGQPGSWFGYLPVVSLVVFVVGFSIGYGTLPFLLLGELFPSKYRSQLSAITGAVNFVSMFAVIKTYHIFDELLTSAGTFWLYACFCAAAFIFALLWVPETKGKSLNEIEDHFQSKKKNQIELTHISRL